MNNRSDSTDFELSELLRELRELRSLVLERGAKRLSDFSRYFDHGELSPSAVNLANYLALRQFDLRVLQERLAQVGLSSLGRSEAGVLANLDAVIGLLGSALGVASDEDLTPHADSGKRLLEQHTEAIFGPMEGERHVRIMVTLPTEAGQDYKLVKNLLRAGTNCVRINCAHDDEHVWSAMVRNVRKAAEETRRHCRILMDLGGHKLRTGPLAAGPRVLHGRPERDSYGCVIAPAEILLYNGASKKLPRCEGPFLTLAGKAFKLLAKGDDLKFTDCRGKLRHLKLAKRLGHNGWLCHCLANVYIEDGTQVSLAKREGDNAGEYALGVENCPPVEIRLRIGDRVLLTFDDEPGLPARRDAKGRPVPARIACGVPEAKLSLEAGESVWFDDGKIGAVVEKIRPDGALLRITQAKNNGSRLLADKGVNFPKTRLRLPPLSEKDLRDLDFVCQHADMVGFSFVESLDDLEFMMAQLPAKGAPNLPIIAKIESDRAVRNLPELILGCIGHHRLGIMIARGDLAVELGSVRLAEIQEEILWVCEAAHVPVIWATQVLESMAKKGEPSRPEFTDAAMSVRAECVMLNKGAYIIRTVEVLADVLSRMQAHQRKKFSRLRALHW